MGLSFTIVDGPRQRNHSQVRVPGTHDHILLSQIRDSTDLEDQVPVFISPGTGWPSYNPRHRVPFRRLLQIAGLRWRCLTSSPHKITTEKHCVWVLYYDHRFSRPVSLVIKHPSGAYDQIFVTVRQIRTCWCWALSLTRGRVCHIQSLVLSISLVTTDNQSASLSWNKAPIWGLRPDLYYCQTVADLMMSGALSDEITGLSFTIAAGARQRSHSRLRVLWDSPQYFAVSDSRLPFASACFSHYPYNLFARTE
jgi:hypothetical protein